MPLHTVKELINEVAEMGVEEFLVTGGEPLARNDLTEVIDYLGFRKQNWTLNTAVMPSECQMTALRENSPGFVAVSLDGPREIHDSVRGRKGAWEEAIEAIRFFRSLPGVRVCAGTTVTRANYPYLEETFHQVAASGAHQWGIHLLVPEGRAAYRKELFLSKRELKRLIKFVARKRQYFNVEMADEIGYLGGFEPLVRDFPLTCGAGRSQCVILPDGEVVPCTTLDRSFSAGNIHEKPLSEIWKEGFGKLREHEPEGECRKCIYYPACKSGCWLQRKSGKECFREVWHVPDSLKTAAGLTVCLGALAAGQSSGTEVQTVISSDGQPEIFYPAPADGIIMGYYVDLSIGCLPGTGLSNDQFDSEDPAWVILNGFQQGNLPSSITGRCDLVLNALNTVHPSLSLAALLWRVVNEPLFETEECTENEMEVVYSTIEALHRKTILWRHVIFENRLDPYIRNGRITDPPFFMYSKAGSRPGDAERYYLTADLNIERWGDANDPPGLTAEYLLEHPYAEQMNLVFQPSGSSEIRLYSGSGYETLSIDSFGRCTFGVFDIMQSTDDTVLLFEIVESGRIEVSITGGRKYSYIELIREAYHQHSEMIHEIIFRMLSEPYSTDEYIIDHLPDEIAGNEILLWPAVRELADSDIEEIRRRAMEKDIDFWMF